MKRILFINTVLNYGSTGHIVEDLGTLANGEGFESFVVYGRKKRSSSLKSVYIGNPVSFLFHVLFTFITDKHGLYSKITTKKLIKTIKKIKPDIIHLHNLHGYYLNYKILFEYLNTINIPVIWTLHDCWAYTGHCSHYTFVKCSDWKNSCSKCPQKTNYPPSLLIDNSRFNFEEKKKIFTSLEKIIITTPSKWLAGEVSQSFLGKYQIFPIYNGIDFSIFKPSQNNPYNILSGKKIILSVANVWDKRKGYDDLIQLNSLIDHNKYQIVMIGLNRKQVQKLPATIIGIERTESVQDLIDYYTFADVYFNASVEETLGMTTIEAQSCGTPCVVYNSTAIPETIVSYETGIIVPANDVNAAYSAIIEICNKDKQLYSSACVNWTKSQFDKNKNYEKYLKLYKEFSK